MLNIISKQNKNKVLLRSVAIDLFIFTLWAIITQKIAIN